MLTVCRSEEIYWHALGQNMTFPFVLYDWDEGTIVDLLRTKERNFNVLSHILLHLWTFRVFPEVRTFTQNILAVSMVEAAVTVQDFLVDMWYIQREIT